MSNYRLLSYRAGNDVRAGLLVGDTVLDASAALAGAAEGLAGGTVLGLLQAWSAAKPLLERAATDFGDGRLKLAPDQARPLAEVTLAAPIHSPGTVYAAAANYRDAQGRMRGKEPPDTTNMRPMFFLKSAWPGAVIGPGEDIRLPWDGARIGWEVELGVVIGQQARNLKAADALSCVAGYTIVNDLSGKNPPHPDDVYKQWFGTNWFRGKCFDTCCPMGPWITPADAIADPQDLQAQLRVNGQVRQEFSTSQMWFDIGAQIETLSQQISLRPGDVISTGTFIRPEGPDDSYLVPGDLIEMTISGLGSMTNRVAG
jgi:2,4-didehydro-3-deoxy-L-rhamnonate hydrolase